MYTTVKVPDIEAFCTIHLDLLFFAGSINHTCLLCHALPFQPPASLEHTRCLSWTPAKDRRRKPSTAFFCAHLLVEHAAPTAVKQLCDNIASKLVADIQSHVDIS